MVEVARKHERRSVLAGSAALHETAIAIAPLPPHARFSLRLAPKVAVDLRNAAGFQLEFPINSAVTFDGRMSARLGPDEWLLLAKGPEHQELEAEIVAALGDAFHSLVDIGHRDVSIEVGGQRACEVINGGCPLDLCDNAFPAAKATRTVFDKAEIILMRPTTEPIYRLECSRSFAPYVFDLLEQFAREFAST